MNNNLDGFYETAKRLRTDWEIITASFQQLPSFDKCIKLNNDESNINSLEYTLSVRNDMYVLKKESDFGKIYRTTRSSFIDLEVFLFSVPIEEYLDSLEEIKKYDEDYYLYTVIRTNIKHYIWNSLPNEVANQIITSLGFSLRVSLTQLINENRYSIVDNNVKIYTFCEDTDYEFNVTRIDNSFSVDYKGGHYCVP